MITLSKNIPEQRGEAHLIEVVRCDGDHGTIELILDFTVWLASMPLHGEKSQRGHDSNPLVPVKIGLRLSEMKRVGGRYVKGIAISVKKGVLRGRQGGFDQSGIPDSGRSSMIFQSHRVQQMHLFQSQKHGMLLGELLKELGIIRANMLGGIFEGIICSTNFLKIVQVASDFVKSRLKAGQFAFCLHNFFIQSHKLLHSHLMRHDAFLNFHERKLPGFRLPSSRFPTPVSAS